MTRWSRPSNGPGRRLVGGRRRRAAAMWVSGMLALTALGASSSVATASGYDNTNPGATVCGDGTSHPIYNLRNFFLSVNGLIYAEIDLRWSKFCNTVWTRAVNRTGSGAGYATERSLTVDETIWVYNCPKTTCPVHTETELNDVLPGNGSSGWSHQFVIPPPGSAGSPAAPQPPSVRGKIVMTTGGVNHPFDTNIEPTWTWEVNAFDNHLNQRIDSTVMTCDNSASRCALAPTPWIYNLEATLPAIMATDLETEILPDWSQLNGGPLLTTCGGTCNYDVLMKGAPGTDPHLNGAGGNTFPAGYTGGTPAYFTGFTVYYNSTPSYVHDCTDGCSGPHHDDRPLLAHELGHTLGLGHCDTDAGMSVMCAARSTPTNPLYFDGYHYWTPRPGDLQAFSLMY